MSASVKVMLSYDYCHFEVSKSVDENITDKDINELRKDVQRLADEAVRQYQIAKQKAESREKDIYEKRRFLEIYERAIVKGPESRSAEEKAIIKQREDENWAEEYERNNYDYEDDEDTYKW
jgi:hypothetical protein